MQLNNKALEALERAFYPEKRRDRNYRLKLIERNMRLERALKAIAETPQPPNPIDAADRLDRVKRRAAAALKQGR